MKPHPRIRKTVKWGGAVVSVVLIYFGMQTDALHVGGVHLAPRQVDFLFFVLIAPLVVATVGAWIRDEIILPSGTPPDPAKMRVRLRRAARVTTPLCLSMMALLATQYAAFCWREAHAPPRMFMAYWTTQAYWAGGAAACSWSIAGASVYWLRPRHSPPGLCPKCGYDRAGLAVGAVCPECGAVALVAKG